MIENRKLIGPLFFGQADALQEANALSTLCLKKYEPFDKSVRNNIGEGCTYYKLGECCFRVGDFEAAIDNYSLCLKQAKEVKNKSREGLSYEKLGSAFERLCDFKKAIEYHSLFLEISKDVGDKSGEGRAYGNLGNAFHRLGYFETAEDYFNRSREIAEEVGDKVLACRAYNGLGKAFLGLGKFKQATQYHRLCLELSKEVGHKSLEGTAYVCLGIVSQNLGDSTKAIEHYILGLEIAKQLGDKSFERTIYGNLGIAFIIRRDSRNALHYLKLYSEVLEGVEVRDVEASHFLILGSSMEVLHWLPVASALYKTSVILFNKMRSLLESEDQWKISFRNEVHSAYTALWRVLLKQNKINEALSAADGGRAQALADLMRSRYGVPASQTISWEQEEIDFSFLSNFTSSIVYQALANGSLHVWVVGTGTTRGSIQYRRTEVDRSIFGYLKALVNEAYKEIGVRSGVNCEDRSLYALRDNITSEDHDNSDTKSSQSSSIREGPLRALYDIVIKPIADLVQGNEVIIVPDGPLWSVPYAALEDLESKHLCESFTVRLIPSLTSLKLIANCPKEHHSRKGALLVGDPWVEEEGKRLQQLEYAKEEVDMIGKILKVAPLTGKDATKANVLKQISSVQLVHIAAHGCAETGEIVLTPDPERTSVIPKKEDYMLTMADVLSVPLRARLVVLSCGCSGRGKIKAEGVVGIARAFMGAGARSVLVTLWAIEDEATLEFMKKFYYHLNEGKSASESLDQARKYLRESDTFNKVKQWAPFVLIGDDVTLEFEKGK